MRDLTTVERTELKPFCVLLKTASRPRSTGKTYLLSFESDEELYRWQDEIYSRSALGSGMSGPSGFVHHVHVGFDALTSGFTVRFIPYAVSYPPPYPAFALRAYPMAGSEQ